MMKLLKTIMVLLVGASIIMAKNYLGAELYSKESVKYGRFEIRMRMVYGNGILSTFFLYYDNSWKGSPEPWREIDLEVLGKNNTGFQSNIITGNSGSQTHSDKFHSFNVKLNEGYHTYAIEWTPDYIAWFFDSKEVRRATGQQVIECREKMQSYRFNLWITSNSNWAGAFNPSVLPVYQYINWVKYSSYTPGQGPNGSNFTFAWQDNFDRFDSQRW
ncbi:MAG: family 16 glycosylhydrolase, partial [Fibrobacter sp.]|nr:family 16 glycosylhydrolase [Fibrobacter sp.]